MIYVIAALIAALSAGTFLLVIAVRCYYRDTAYLRKRLGYLIEDRDKAQAELRRQQELHDTDVTLETRALRNQLASVRDQYAALDRDYKGLQVSLREIHEDVYNAMLQSEKRSRGLRDRLFTAFAESGAGPQDSTLDAGCNGDKE